MSARPQVAPHRVGSHPVLRCAGCRQTVSPWAARCSQCGHSCEDANEVADEAFSDDLPAVEESEVNGSPDPSSLDQSPPRDVIGRGRRWSRRPVAAAGRRHHCGDRPYRRDVAAVTSTSTGAAPEAWIGRLRGTIVAQAFTGALVASAPDGPTRVASPPCPSPPGSFRSTWPRRTAACSCTRPATLPRPDPGAIINVGSDTLTASDSAALQALHSRP